MANVDHEASALIEAAERLAPLLRANARDAEIARRPLDEVMVAVRESGLLSLMVPKRYGGHEADIDTFFEVALILSRADASMGWLISFYIEHAFWFCGFPEDFQAEVFAERPYALAPASLNVTGGAAKKVEGGYELSGTWQWGTGIVHAEWVLIGGLVVGESGTTVPLFFAVPRDAVESIDTWHVAGMCSTGSYDIRVESVFVPERQTVSMIELTNATGEGSRLHESDLYRTPLVPILGFAAGLPMLGAAQMALEEYRMQTKAKIEAKQLRAGGALGNEGKPAVVARAALTIDAAELMFRDVLRDLMEQRQNATREMRSAWLARMSHAVFMCREAVQEICSVTGASGSKLDNPIQRALRDISTGSNHAIFDRESRYSDYGRLLLDQPIQNGMV